MLRGAAAAFHAALAGVGDDAATLRRALKRSRRRDQLRAAALVLPLFVFLAACFVLPIGAMLSRGVIDTDIARILPDVTAALKGWDGRDLPAESAYAALIADIRGARDAGMLASAATRLNYDVPGFRTLLFTTGRQLPSELSGSARDTLIGIDPKWGERETWAVIRRAGGPVAYVIAAQPPGRAAMLLFLVLLPFWTSLLVRTAAWVVLLQREGVLNSLFLSLGLA